MNVGSFELNVLVSDRPVREYGHQGKTYIEGRKGSVFTLKFRNNYPHRVLVVPSVDGLSTVDGSPAAGGSRGYVVAGYSSLEIKGWRKNLNEVASFVFTDREKSYAGQAHGTQNCGVIAAKVFSEKPTFVLAALQNTQPYHIHYHYPWFQQPVLPVFTPVQPVITWCDGTSSGAVTSGLVGASNNVAGPAVTANYLAVAVNESVGAAQADFNIGTGWGSEEKDVVQETEFERDCELATLEIYYSDEAGLTTAGIPLVKSPLVTKPMPQAFGGFCKPPTVTA